MENKEKDFDGIVLEDDQLEEISGGFNIGDTVHVNSQLVEYCPRCGRLVQNLPATITGVRGVLDNKTIYWVTFSCCGYKSSRSEVAFC
jgi:hypothetical protein